jgi:hypothetical protein
MTIWAALQVDLSNNSPDETIKENAKDMLALLTPVLKSYMTDQGVEAASRAMQCLGGHGYIREWGMEQFLCDARIAPIYEGTNGIQAMDLIGRKLPMKNGDVIKNYFAMIQTFIEDNKDDPELELYTTLLDKASKRQQVASLWLMENATTNPDHAGATAHYYLNLMALVTMGYFWATIVKKSKEMMAANEGDKEFLKNKIITADFFFTHILPETTALRIKVEAGADNVMALDAATF